MANADTLPRLLTVPEVADELGLSKRTVRRRIADGEIPAVKLGRTCTPQKLAAYGGKLSRALVDRFDLVVHMPRPRGSELDTRPGEASRPVRARVVPAAEELGRRRPRLGSEARALLTRAVDTLPLSARGRARVARVSATIAALASDEEIAATHVAEALSYRAPRELAT
jgi:magnesium chelatase family protein